jgi:glycosyltransferase involved in cell wall biosynthesis
MKIVHFIASSGMGGAEKFVVSLCNLLAKNNIEIHLFLPNKSAIKTLISPLVNIHTLRASTNRYNPVFYWELYQLIRTIKPDIIHTHGAKATQLIHRLKWAIKPLHVATKHNARKGSIFNHINHVVGVSKESVESITSRQKTLIYNGIIPEKILPSSTNEVFTVLAVGRLDPIKGFDKLIDACSKLTFNYRLEIVGEGPYQRNLELLIKKLHLQNQVFLSGFSDKIPQKMHDADLVVQPSYSEGFSLVMIEALFYAKVFIATPVGGAKEILTTKFLSTHQQMQKKLEDVYRKYDEYKKSFAQLSEQKRNEFTMEKCAKNYRIFYTKIKENNGHIA